jgi:hypothetical protein
MKRREYPGMLLLYCVCLSTLDSLAYKKQHYFFEITRYVYGKGTKHRVIIFNQVATTNRLTFTCYFGVLKICVFFYCKNICCHSMSADR